VGPGKKLRAAVASAGVTGAAALSAAVVLAGGRGLGSLFELGAFTVILGLSWVFPFLVLRREQTEAFQLDEAFLVAMALLVPPLGTVVAFALASVAAQLVRRRPLSRIAFNTGQSVTSVALALGVASILGGGPAGGPRSLVAAVAAAGVFFVVNGISVSAVIALVEGEPFWSTWSDSLGFRLLVWVASVATGLLAGLAGSAYSWALLLAAIPLGALQVVLAGSLRARRDRERVDGLLRTALTAHSSVEPGEVEAAITESARTHLRCRRAAITETPPGPGELGRPIPGFEDPQRWLVVSDRRGEEPWGAQDARMLEAIVAVGSAAVQNATLVDQIKHQVLHDALTGLPNQLLFEERLTSAISRAPRSGEGVAVLFVDLDRFKRVNDSMGHPAGNALLRQAAERIAAMVRPGDTVARMGGDEFTLLVTDIRADVEAVAVARRLIDGFRQPFLIEGQELFVTPSIGIAVCPEAGTRASTLLKNADVAMYRAKDAGRNGYEVYVADMNATARRRLSLESELHNALAEGQLRVLYQPQMSVSSGRMVGVEALVRWDHPTLGRIAPDVFLPLAEETGLIVDIDDWMLRTACAQGRRWLDAGLPSLRMAVNLSGRAFQRSGVVERVVEALQATGLPAHLLELEVTETMAVDQVPGTQRLFRQLDALGVRLAIDDFGTGYSALSRLHGLPFHTLKIDQSFVARIAGDTEEEPLVAAMIAMAHALALEVVAEGVETSGQQAFLERRGCDMVQGYLFGRPVEAEELERLLEEVPVLV
jgi:diguanylate cyclase (GGDEF)-like protein